MPLDELVESDNEQVVFTMSFIALSAKLAEVDGPINEAELEFLLETFPVNYVHYQKIIDLIDLACEAESLEEYYVNRILQFYPASQQLYWQLMAALTELALADGPLTKLELTWLLAAADCFNLAKDHFFLMLKRILIPTIDPYKLLDLDGKPTKKELDQAYKKALRKYHPDQLTGNKLVAIEYIKLSEEKCALLQDAYNALKPKR